MLVGLLLSQGNFAPTKSSSVLKCGCQLMQIDLYSGCKTVECEYKLR